MKRAGKTQRVQRGSAWRFGSCGRLAVAALAAAAPACAPHADQVHSEESVSESSAAITVSPPSTLMRFLETAGFLDGVSCESWPRQVELSAAPSLDSMYETYASGTSAEQHLASGVAWLRDQVARIGVDTLHAIGSSDELVLTTATLPDGVRHIVVDGTKNVAYSIDYGYLCTNEDLDASACRENLTTLAGFGQVRVLERRDRWERTATNSETTRTVLLAAPTVRIESNVDLAVGLVIAAERVVGGAPLQEGEVLADRPQTIAVSVRHHAVPLVEQWREDASRDTSAGLLAVLAAEVGGIQSLQASNGARLRSIQVTDTSDAPMITPQGDATVPVSAFVSVVNQATSQGAQAQAGSDATCFTHGSGHVVCRIDRDFWVPVTRTIDLQLPDVRQEWQEGGAVYFARGTGPAPSLVAPGGAPVTVTTVVPEQFTANLLGGLNPSCSTTGPIQLDDFTQEFQRTCRIVTHVDLTIGGQTHTLEVTPPPFQYGEAPSYIPPLTSQVRDVIHQSILAKNGVPDHGVTGVVGNGNNGALAQFAGQLLSRGLYFEQLYRNTEAAGLVSGIPSEGYHTLGALIDVFRAADHGAYISDSLRESVVAVRDHLELSELTDLGSLNALGLPYGSIATGWMPRRLSGSTNFPSGINDVTGRWNTIGGLVTELNEATADLNDAARFALLAQNLTNYVNVSKDVASQLEAAAQAEVVNGGVALEKLKETVEELERAQAELQSSWVEIWNCPNGFDSCAGTMAKRVEELKAQCPPEPGEDWLFKLVEIAIQVVPYVSAASGVLSTVVDIQEFMQDHPSFFNLTEVAKADLASGIETMKKVAEIGKKIKKYAETAKSALEGWKKFNDYVEMHPEVCDRSSTQYATLQNLMANSALLQGLLDSMAVQARTLEVVSGSIVNYVAFQRVNTAANRQLKDGATALGQSLSDLGPDAGDWVSTKEAFVRAACETTQVALRAAQSELHHVSQLLQTSSGRSVTTPYLTVPADPRSSSASPEYNAADYEESFYASVWDPEAFSNRFSTDGSSVTSSFIEKAAERFQQLTEVQMCDGPDTTFPKVRYVVRKVIQGDQLQRFKATGRADFPISFHDVIEGGNAIGENAGESRLTAVAERRSGSTSFDLDLTSPVVLSVAYSGCTGPEADPCCSETSCRQELQTNSLPHLVGHGRHDVASACENEDERLFSTTLVRDVDRYAGTCLVNVSSPRQVVPVPFIDATRQLPQLLTERVDQPICNQLSNSLVFSAGRGTPVMGSWSLTGTAELASLVERELAQDITAPGLGSNWTSATQDLTGVEVLFFVGAEARSESQSPAFALSETDPNQQQLLTNTMSFESPVYWSSTNAVLGSSSQATHGQFSLSIQGGGYLPVDSLPLTLGPLPSGVRKLAFDLLIPTQQPNRWWIGASQMFVTIPSANLYNAYLGQVELTPLPIASFTKLSFTLPAQVRTALAQPRSDVRVTVVLNINNGSGPFLIDNLRLE